MDYDKTKVPATYDAARGYSPTVMQLWLDVLSDHIERDQVANILDLGCGTGRYSRALAEHFGAALTGVDPSEDMLAQARDKNTGNGAMAFLAGGGDKVPLESAAVDLVFMSMVYHHLRNPEAVARECRRVLRPGGHVFLRNGTADQIESYPYIDFFPGVREIIAARLATGAAISAVFEAAGFALHAQGVIAHPMASHWREFTDKMALRADSFVAALPDQAFEAGMAALLAHGDQVDSSGPVTVNVEYFVFSVR